MVRHGRNASGRNSRSRGRRQRGMVTMELAVGILAAAVLLAMGSAVIGLLILQDRCRDVAGMVAREHGRGDANGERTARGVAPRGASITVTETAGWVRVTVTASRSWGRIGPVTVSGQATVPMEPGQGQP